MASWPIPALSEPELQIRRPSPAAPEPLRAPPPATLTALEWSIVAMAETDGLSSLRQPSRIVAALGNLFGVRRPNRLANDRLEALRRLAVYAWRYRWNVPDSELRNFLTAGYSLDQYQLIQESMAQARTRSAQRRRIGR